MLVEFQECIMTCWSVYISVPTQIAFFEFPVFPVYSRSGRKFSLYQFT